MNDIAKQAEAAMIPPVDVFEDAAGITPYADLPGVPKDKLDLQLEADTLTIEGEVALDVPEGMDATHAEVSAVALPAQLHAVARARHRQGERRVQARRAQAAHSQGRTRAAAQDRDQGRLMQRARPASSFAPGGLPLRRNNRPIQRRGLAT